MILAWHGVYTWQGYQVFAVLFCERVVELAIAVFRVDLRATRQAVDRDIELYIKLDLFLHVLDDFEMLSACVWVSSLCLRDGRNIERIQQGREMRHCRSRN